jgi:molybdopterin synthase sulfur carrier subunit
MIRVLLPTHLRELAGVDDEVLLDVIGPVSQRTVLDALEARYPMLCGTIRDQATGKRRAFLRFFACRRDLSHESPDAPLPEAISRGTELFLVVGAIAGG